ncbi:MAG: hypothetical protein JSW52_10050 [Candidatus Coatesbacteria bacterium]|nr:MAG: hypothetical protein JSW52_10050 [Candidatus Coatesbacteria bacterium]
MAGRKVNPTTETETLLIGALIVGILATGGFSEANANDLYGFIGYGSYEIPNGVENPEDYVSEEVVRFSAARYVSNLYPDMEQLPGYIEVYHRFPKIPENRACCYVLAGPETGITSLEELLRRHGKAFDEVIKEYVSYDEERPGYGIWKAYSGPGLIDEYYEIIYGLPQPQTREELMARGKLLSWSASSVHRDYRENDFGESTPNFVSEYLGAETIAETILGTEDARLDMICLCPPLLVFKGAGHTIYFKFDGQRYYYVDGAVDLYIPGLHNGDQEPFYNQNPDGTPEYSEENRAYWEGREAEFDGLEDG